MPLNYISWLSARSALIGDEEVDAALKNLVFELDEKVKASEDTDWWPPGTSCSRPNLTRANLTSVLGLVVPAY